MKPNKNIVIVVAISIFFSIISDMSFVKENHFNLITVNSILIGFLFTSLSIMLGFLNEKIVQLFEKAGALKVVYKSIALGIENSLYSIVISFLNMVILEKYISKKFLLNMLYSLEFVLLIVTLYYLLITIREVRTVVESIRRDNLRTKEKERIGKEIEELFKQK